MKKIIDWLIYEDEGGPCLSDTPMPNWLAIIVFLLLGGTIYCFVKGL